jgi:hypothetical protein
LTDDHGEQERAQRRGAVERLQGDQLGVEVPAGERAGAVGRDSKHDLDSPARPIWSSLIASSSRPAAAIWRVTAATTK